ncbi:hypothetical protein M501DRAFT_1027763 [Patellaria atrata CBS 101060]|uniref:Uncharacterized protein n=1 Tax=Patellaria atrata CBS 101060 TaxID=1346257 RepID=A0A9P4SI05_9PEZI|nr:hypothetical protein M501DRAFT_1027763 [Patellaria atrata CBS 101060]
MDSVEKILNLNATYGKNFKQALKECSKRLQKQPQNTYLLYWKALIFHSLSAFDESLQICHELCDWKPAIGDLVFLSHIYRLIFLCHQFSSNPGPEHFPLTAGPKAQRIWVNAVLLCSDKKVDPVLAYRTYMENAMSLSCIKDVQNALFFLRNTSKNEPKYYFSWIVMSQIVSDRLRSNDGRASEQIANQAFSSLKQSIDNTISGKDDRPPIQSAREKRLVVTIYKKQKRVAELLGDAQTFSLIHTAEDDTILQSQLDLFEEKSDWKSMWHLSSHTMNQGLEESASPFQKSLAEEWWLWKAVITSVDELRDEEITKTFNSLRSKHTEAHQNTRKVRITAIAVLSHASYTSKVFNFCKDFFCDFFELPSCFNDLARYVQDLDVDYQRAFLDHVSTWSESKRTEDEDDHDAYLRWLALEVIALKFDYLLLFSKPDKCGTEFTDDFVSNCIQIYTLSQSTGDTATCDDALILAVMVLFRLSTGSDLPTSREQCHLQAACLLSYLVERSPNNRGAQLLYVYYFTLMGFGSLAIGRYRDINIKEIMVDSLSYVLFSRISSIHPFDVTTGSTQQSGDLSSMLTSAIKVYPASLDKIRAFMSADIKEVEYDKLFEVAELQDSLSQSITRQMLIQEQRRILRLRGLPSNDRDHRGQAIRWDNLNDNRDFNALPDFECIGRVNPVQRLDGDSRGGISWIAGREFVETTWDLLEGRPFDLNLMQSPLWETSSTAPDKSTDDELMCTALYEAILRAIHDIYAASDDPHLRKLVVGIPVSGITKALEDIEKKLILQGPLKLSHFEKEEEFWEFKPRWSFYHSRFITLDALKAVTKLLAIVHPITKQKSHKLKKEVSQKQLDQISSLVDQTYKTIRKQAISLKNKLAEDEMQNFESVVLDENVVGELIGGLIGRENVRKYGSRFYGSTQEALDGLLNVKL